MPAAPISHGGVKITSPHALGSQDFTLCAVWSIKEFGEIVGNGRVVPAEGPVKGAARIRVLVIGFGLPSGGIVFHYLQSSKVDSLFRAKLLQICGDIYDDFR